MSNLSIFSAIIRLLVVIPFLGKLLAEAFLEFSKPFWSACCVPGSGGGCTKLENVCPFLPASLTSNFFFTAAVLLFPPSLLADFPFKLLPHLRVAVLLMWKFSSALRRCALQSVLPLFSGCGDVFKVTLPFCL